MKLFWFEFNGLSCGGYALIAATGLHAACKVFREYLKSKGMEEKRQAYSCRELDWYREGILMEDSGE